MADTNGNKIPIAALIDVTGGVSTAARALGVSHTPVSRMLRTGAHTLSPEAIARLSMLLGADPNGDARAGLHIWNGRPALTAIQDAVKWAFPDGAEMAAAPWSVPPTSITELVGRVRMRRELAVLTDQRVWVVLRTPAGRIYRPNEIGPNISWRGGATDPQVLSITGEEPEWRLTTEPTLLDVRRAWGDPADASPVAAPEAGPDWADVIHTATRLRMTPADVLQLMRTAVEVDEPNA